MTDRRSFLIGALGTTLVAALKAQDPTVTDVDVQLVPNARRLRLETLNFGLPLPPGLLLDPLMARVIGPDGQEIEAAVRPLETQGDMMRVTVLDVLWHWAPPVWCIPVQSGSVWVPANSVSTGFPN